MSYDGPRVPLTDGLRLDHIGIAVPDLEKALGFWRDQLGATVRGTETVESQGVRVAFLATGDATTELLGGAETYIDVHMANSGTATQSSPKR